MDAPASFGTVFVGSLMLGTLAMAIASGITFSYHWFRFGGDRSEAALATGVYAAGCAALILLFTVASRMTL